VDNEFITFTTFRQEIARYLFGMGTNPMLPIRQAVLVARDFDAAVKAMRTKLPLADPFHDSEVAPFGVRNAVMELGDTFVEVNAPVEEGTAAGRHLERIGGDGGYMVMFQLDDIAAARARIQPLGLRVAYELDYEGDTDIHPPPPFFCAICVDS
jgi:hypothetical protein